MGEQVITSMAALCEAVTKMLEQVPTITSMAMHYLTTIASCFPNLTSLSLAGNTSLHMLETHVYRQICIDTCIPMPVNKSALVFPHFYTHLSLGPDPSFWQAHAYRMR